MNTNTKTMKMKTQNAMTTPVNPTQTMKQSIITTRSQVSWTNNMVRGLRKKGGLEKKNVTSH